jgi:hypothetical protein
MSSPHSPEPVNPFAPSSILDEERGVFADGAVLRRAYFVHREIEFTRPLAGLLVYDGWWFRQRVTFNEHVLWSQISWVHFCDKIEFRLPAEIDPQTPRIRIDIRFGRGLAIRRFQVTVDGIVAYDEIV